jgi:hypothetical protein
MDITEKEDPKASGDLPLAQWMGKVLPQSYAAAEQLKGVTNANKNERRAVG